MAAPMEKTRHAGIWKCGGRYVFSYWGDERKLTEVTPRDVAQLVSHLTQQTGKSGRPLADNTVRNSSTPCAPALPRRSRTGSFV